VSILDIPNFDQLTDLQRLELAEELIASIRHPEDLPAPVAHRLELEKRWAEYEQNPGLALSPEQFRSRVKAGLQ
jgi:putative addiction module component (TIGR02574 family)